MPIAMVGNCFLTESQSAAIDALPDHVDAMAPTAETLRPASAYTDAAHYALEHARLIRQSALPAAPSAVLPRPKTVWAHSDFGLPILLTRDAKGHAHAFLNVCTHRGAKLVESEGPHGCARLTCPFHAWTYGLDGSLSAVPRKEVFPTLDKAEYGLRRLPLREAGGILWIGLDPEFEPDFSETGGQLEADFKAFGVGAMHHYGLRRFDLAANWKILIETFLETYHVPPLHKDTVASQFAEVPTVTTRIGRHSRQTTGRAHFKREGLQLTAETLHRHITHAYHLFPTAVLVTSPYHFNFIVMMPRAADRTIVHCHMLTREPPTSEEARALFDKTIAYNFDRVFGTEDFRAAQLVQEGLASGALETVRFGGLEEALADLHRAIAEALT
jgi:phenylpropionate dioxygenase-like ring-hydroxylating dioxygenase large terminal subunit